MSDLLIKCGRLTLNLPEKIENVDGTACTKLLALKGQKFDQNHQNNYSVVTFCCFMPKPEARGIKGSIF